MFYELLVNTSPEEKFEQGVLYGAIVLPEDDGEMLEESDEELELDDDEPRSREKRVSKKAKRRKARERRRRRNRRKNKKNGKKKTAKGRNEEVEEPPAVAILGQETGATVDEEPPAIPIPGEETGASVDEDGLKLPPIEPCDIHGAPCDIFLPVPVPPPPPARRRRQISDAVPPTGKRYRKEVSQLSGAEVQTLVQVFSFMATVSIDDTDLVTLFSRIRKFKAAPEALDNFWWHRDFLYR